MGYIFDFKDTNAYADWCNEPARQHDFKLQTEAMLKMLSPLPKRTVLDIGCGAGRCFPALLNQGLLVSGVDPSPYMLDVAGERFGMRVDLHRALAEDLPFEDNTFNYSVLMTSLEFTDRPARAIEEACRVTRDKIFIGVLNKYAPMNIHRRIKKFFVHTPLSQARAFGIWELKRMIYDIIGHVPISWSTTLQFPFWRCRATAYLENRPLVQKSPWGGMIAMGITPVPRFRTRPLTISICRKRPCGPLSGLAREMKSEDHEDTFV